MVVSAKEDSEPSYKIKTALKYGIPVISTDFVTACIEKGKLLHPDDFIVFGTKPTNNFSSGKVTSTGKLSICYFHKA